MIGEAGCNEDRDKKYRRNEYLINIIFKPDVIKNPQSGD